MCNARICLKCAVMHYKTIKFNNNITKHTQYFQICKVLYCHFARGAHRKMKCSFLYPPPPPPHPKENGSTPLLESRPTDWNTYMTFCLVVMPLNLGEASSTVDLVLIDYNSHLVKYVQSDRQNIYPDLGKITKTITFLNV